MGKNDRHMTVPQDSKSKIAKGSSYRKNCENHRFPNENKPWPNEVHHILCEHAIKAFSKADIPYEDFLYIKRCLRITDDPGGPNGKWDIDSPKNLIGLPLKIAVTQKNQIDLNLPCHNYDHNTKRGYTWEVKDYLHNRVWKNLKAAQGGHDVQPENIRKQLDNCIEHFKKLLDPANKGARGRRNGGTRKSWERRFEPSQKDRWFEPFSMAKDPTPKRPFSGRKRKVFAAVK
jgi:hypothetical protein